MLKSTSSWIANSECTLDVHICISHTLNVFSILTSRVRYKRNGADTKEVPLIGIGFQAFIDNIFWYLPFSSTRQAAEFLAKRDMSDENWIVKREKVAAEHKLERTPNDLREGWKTVEDLAERQRACQGQRR
jgi:hypothetical protein